MTDFTPQDHITEREPGRWEDCTFAAMLETMRLALPGGRSIPPTIEEVNRYRAVAGYPDNHPGVTIEDTIPAAKQLYGLRDEQYELTREWATLAPALESPGKVCVVTGSAGAIPAGERITSFMGAHAVAKHGVRVRCDPLGPKDGVYKGNTWALSLWRDFTSGLSEWQALIMQAQGDTMLSMGGITVISSKIVVVVRRTGLLKSPDGERLAYAQAGYKYPLLGADSGYRMVVVRTAIPYPDHVARDTGLYLKAEDITIENAPPIPTADVKHKVTMFVDNVLKHTEEV
jgi:hypothetical protein